MAISFRVYRFSSVYPASSPARPAPSRPPRSPLPLQERGTGKGPSSTSLLLAGSVGRRADVVGTGHDLAGVVVADATDAAPSAVRVGGADGAGVGAAGSGERHGKGTDDRGHRETEKQHLLAHFRSSVERAFMGGVASLG